MQCKCRGCFDHYWDSDGASASSSWHEESIAHPLCGAPMSKGIKDYSLFIYLPIRAHYSGESEISGDLMISSSSSWARQARLAGVGDTLSLLLFCFFCSQSTSARSSIVRWSPPSLRLKLVIKFNWESGRGKYCLVVVRRAGLLLDNYN